MVTTTIKQSKKLVRLGLDPKTADMNWWGNEKIGVEYNLDFIPYSKKSVYYSCLPAWSLDALIEVIPKEIDGNDLAIMYTSYGEGWFVGYAKFSDGYYEGLIHEVFGETKIDAAYNMVCHLLGQGLIKKRRLKKR